MHRYGGGGGGVSGRENFVGECVSRGATGRDARSLVQRGGGGVACLSNHL